MHNDSYNINKYTEEWFYLSAVFEQLQLLRLFAPPNKAFLDGGKTKAPIMLFKLR